MRDLLNKEIGDEFVGLAGMELGCPEYEKTVNGITKLMEKRIELEKFDVERQDKLDVQTKQDELAAVKEELDKQERENRLYLQEKQLEMQQRQLDLQKKQHKTSTIVNILSIAATVGVALIGVGVKVWGTKTTFEYEDKGITQTTIPGKEFTKQLFNK